METPTNTTHLPEAVLTEIQARLPLRSITRFKSVCKTWKSAIESVYFRRLFVSLHQNSSSSWSLMWETKEVMGFHGCETWDLPKSLASYIPPPFKFTWTPFVYEASSNGLVLIEGTNNVCYVGNIVLQQWVEIPSPPHNSVVLGLATRVDEDGVVLGFKVVRLAGVSTNDEFSACLSVCVYTSETGIWTSKRLHCPHPNDRITNLPAMTLNGTIYLSQPASDLAEPGVLISHDFYVESDQCSVIPLPDHSNHDKDFKRAALTTSRGFVMYIKTLAQEEDNMLKVWRLINDSGDGCWQVLWGIPIPFINSYAPMTMHPFDSDIVYLWSQQSRHLVSCNLRTQNYRILRDSKHQDCFMGQSVCYKHIDELWKSRQSYWDLGASVDLFHLVLPRWIESMPCPPQVEMIDTTSLLSYITSMHWTPKKG